MTERTTRPAPTRTRSLACLYLLVACFITVPAADCQSAAEPDAYSLLPDAPGFSEPIADAPISTAAPSALVSSSRATPADPDPSSPSPAADPLAGKFVPPRYATKYDKYIDAGEIAPSLTARDKFLLGARATVTPFTLMSVLTSAGLEQARNSSPNYGSHLTAFGQRIGASAARDGTETIFTDSFLSPLLHEDPRYFQLGKGHSILDRTFYAVSRVFVVKRDDGRLQANYALFGGYIGSIALTNVYYPQINRGFTQNAESFGGALGGAAFSLVFREFLSDGLQAAHLARR